MERHNINRRAFVAGGCALAASVALGCAARPFAADANVLRPPGALPEDQFIARCITCDRCTSVCPTSVIEPMCLEDGALQVRTPKLSYADGSCTFCGLCQQVCPTAAIGSCDPYAPQDGRIGVARVLPEQCIAYTGDGACGVCVEACPYEALHFDGEKRVYVDDAKCNGCGECVRVCKANVFTSFSGSTRGIEVVTEKTFAGEAA